MITVADAVANIVKHSPLLEEGLSRGLMNTSAVARDLREEVEKRTFKGVTEGAIIMSLQRLSATLHKLSYSPRVFEGTPDMVIRSNLFEYTIANSLTLTGKQQQLLTLVGGRSNRDFLTITSGVFETTIIASDNLYDNIHTILQGEMAQGEIRGLASITLRLTKDIVVAPGSYVQILRLIAWEGINVIEVVSTYLELTLILKQEEVDRAFSVLKNTFS